MLVTSPHKEIFPQDQQGSYLHQKILCCSFALVNAGPWDCRGFMFIGFMAAIHRIMAIRLCTWSLAWYFPNGTVATEATVTGRRILPGITPGIIQNTHKRASKHARTHQDQSSWSREDTESFLWSCVQATSGSHLFEKDLASLKLLFLTSAPIHGTKLN